MHQLANSVIIFDEIQTLPVRCVYLFNAALRFLTVSCGSTAVLCTATQPLLDRVKPTFALELGVDRQMMPDTERLFEALDRVDVIDKRKTGGWREDDVARLAEQEQKETGSVLVIVNTKKEASDLFCKLRESAGYKLYHLSTNMCPAHRMDILSVVRKALDKEDPVICVSTQLIEAGVDIDFGCVIRFMAGLDSITQAAGRCNRNNRRPIKGRVYIVNPADENLDRLKDIKIGRDKAERVLDEYIEDPEQYRMGITDPKAMQQYYEYYFYDRAGEMGYSITGDSEAGREDTLVSLLSSNTLSVKAYQLNNDDRIPDIFLRQSFMTASKIFKAIDSPTQGIIVPYGDGGRRMIGELCACCDLEHQQRLLKMAQRYSVNVFSYMFEKLFRKEVIHEIHKGAGIFYLDEQYYHKECGIDDQLVNKMEFLNY